MKTFVITGCSRGCGRAWAEYFAERDWRVFGCARSAEAVQEMNSSFGSPHQFGAVDVSSETEVKSWAEQVLAQATPDLLVNNAAMMNHPAPMWEVPAEEFDRLIDINVKGTAHVVRAFLPAMIQAERGMVINLSSGWGRSTSPDVGPYCTSKWAIEGYSRSLAQDVPRGIGVVALNPGIIQTDMLKTCWADGAGHYPTPDEWIKQAGPFLENLSPADNGQSLSVP